MRHLVCKWLFASMIILTAAITARAADAPPRYRLEVGQELVYEGASRFKYENGTHGTKDKTTFWVTRQNADGSWHVIAQNESTFQQIFSSVQESPGRTDSVLGAFDLFPDGRITNASERFEEKRLPAMLIRLPADIASTRKGWEQAGEAGDKSVFRLLAPTNAPADKWVFEKTDHGIFNEVYLSTSKAVIYFDAQKGIITKTESEQTQGYGFNGKGTGTNELKSVTKRDAAWMAQLVKETEILAGAKKLLAAAYKAQQAGADINQLSAAEKSLRDGKNQVKLPLVVAAFHLQLDEFIRYSKYYAAEKPKQETVLNQPAFEWDTVDIDGKKHSLANYRGKVVVLDFWYRGCGWCIRAMPQIKEVTTHYKDKPVVVFGMNTDHEEKDARFVIEKLSLNYATLKATGLPEKFGVKGFPTLIIIDQKGVVRGRHVGYSATLREELTKEIDGLLANGK